MGSSVTGSKLRAQVRDILKEELASMLADVSYRLDVLYEAQRSGRFGSRDLNLAAHQLDGFTVTNNTPVAGSIAWADCNIVYKGTNYAITNGNTALKYVWWDMDAVPNTVFQMSNTKPVLMDDDVLVFINDAGTHQTVLGNGRMTHGAAILAGSVQGAEIANGAIAKLNLASGAVDSDILATNAVIAGKIADGAVTTTKIGSKAVAAGNIADGGVTATQLATNAVTEVKILNGAITTTKIGAKAVASGNIADGGVGTTQLAASAVTDAKIGTGAVTSDKLGSSAVTSVKIADDAVTASKIGAGQVATSKLNTALHMIF